MIRKLKWKFVAVNMALVSLVLLIVFLLLVISYYRNAAKDSLEAMQSALMRTPDMDVPKFEIGGKKPGPATSMVPIFTVSVDSEWNILRVSTNNQNIEITDEVLKEAVEAVSQSGERSGILSGFSLRYLYEQDRDGYQIAFADRTAETESLWNLIRLSLLVGFPGLAAFFLISLFLAEWMIKPVKEAWRSQKQFVADASHELKTPITVILANAGILLSHKDSTIGEQQKWVDYISAEAGRMKELVENMLFLAKSDMNGAQTIKTDVNLSDVVLSSLLVFESVAFEAGVKLNGEVAPDIHVNGNEAELRQLVMILLDNACKYTEKKGSVTLILEKSQDKIRLSVNNTGEVILPEDLPHLFERFYRTDKSRARSKGGYGLGLAIAKQIVMNHRGKITAESSPKYGTTFRVQL